MNHLLSIRTNIMYSKEKEKYNRFQEIILLVDKPLYRYSTEGEIVMERGIEELRFVVSVIAFEDLINVLSKLKEADESELK